MAKVFRMVLRCLSVSLKSQLWIIDILKFDCFNNKIAIKNHFKQYPRVYFMKSLGVLNWLEPIVLNMRSMDFEIYGLLSPVLYLVEEVKNGMDVRFFLLSCSYFWQSYNKRDNCVRQTWEYTWAQSKSFATRWKIRRAKIYRETVTYSQD